MLGSAAHAVQPKFFKLNNNKASFSLASLKANNKHFTIVREDPSPRFIAMPNKPKFMPLSGVAIVTAQSYIKPKAEADIAFESSAELAWPVDPKLKQWVSSPFGWREDPFTKERAFHAGIDIAVPVGTSVRAVAAGMVTGVGEHPRLGRFVKVTHAEDDEVYSLYGHLKGWDVKEGDRVHLGEKLGEVGMTGRTTGAHLDYSLRRNGQPIDPIPNMNVPSVIR